MNSFSRYLAITVGLIFFCSGSAHAHNVGIQLKVQDDQIEVWVKYDDNVPAKRAKILLSNDGVPMRDGSTDDEGKWSFPIPKPGEYQIRADAGAGHLAFAEFTVDSENKVHFGRHGSNSPIHFPWVQATIGLVVIAVLAGSMILAARLSRQPEKAPKPQVEEKKLDQN